MAIIKKSKRAANAAVMYTRRNGIKTVTGKWLFVRGAYVQVRCTKRTNLALKIRINLALKKLCNNTLKG